MRRMNSNRLVSAAALLAAQSLAACATSDIRIFKSKELAISPFWLSNGKQEAQWKLETNRGPRRKR